MIDCKAEPDFQLPPGNTSLVIAAEEGKDKTVKILIDSKANVSMETLNGSTALIRGSMASKEACCALLIEAGADPQSETKFGETALQMAVVSQDPTAIMTLIKCKADVDHITSRGMTPLIRAAILNKPRSATVLRLAGCQIALETRKCGTATECAAERGFTEVIKAIMLEPKARATVNHETLEGDTALTKAVKANQIEAGKQLIEQYGALVDRSTKFGNTPLILATQLGFPEMCKMLLEHHANPDRETRIGTAREIALRLGNRAIIEVMIKVKGPQPSIHPTQKAIARAEQRASIVRQNAGQE